jgi:hypothetical protein
MRRVAQEVMNSKAVGKDRTLDEVLNYLISAGGKIHQTTLEMRQYIPATPHRYFKSNYSPGFSLQSASEVTGT